MVSNKVMWVIKFCFPVLYGDPIKYSCVCLVYVGEGWHFVDKIASFSLMILRLNLKQKMKRRVLND